MTALLPETASQTAGPYLHIGCLPRRAGLTAGPLEAIGASSVGPDARGERIRVAGRVIDGAGDPVTDAMIESWQADAAGLYPGQDGADPAVTGFCRMATDAAGRFSLETVKPGPVAGRDGTPGAPHLDLWMVARGINLGLSTRMYFEGDDHARDPLLTRISPPDRAETLIARREGPGAYRFDIHLQGDRETVFLDV